MFKKGMLVSFFIVGFAFSFITFIRSATQNAHQNIERSTASAEATKS